MDLSGRTTAQTAQWAIGLASGDTRIWGMTAAALAGRPDLGFAAVAAWTAASFLAHLARLAQAYATPRERVTSWLAR